MISLLLAIIYLTFISLGLPDSLLGSVWPSMYQEIGSTASGAGTIYMIIAACTIVSSLNADRIIHKFGTANVIVVSVAATAIALFGFSICTEYWHLILWALPYGLGAGAIDSALNNYVALHFKARHMSWLHCMWGVGASVGPYIMGLCLTSSSTWRNGYQIIGVIQLVITAILFLSLPLWKSEKMEAEETKRNVLSIKEAAALPGAKALFVTFFCYCALESSAGLWASSWLNNVKGIDASTAAYYASLFYVGITGGRAVCGFISEKLGDKNMIRMGLGIILAGTAMLILPLGASFVIIGLVMIGLGCAPIYPSIIHSTPDRFGAENSQSLVGMEMASAYMGSLLMPKVFGWFSDFIGFGFYPVYLLLICALMLVMSERTNQKTMK